MHKDNRVFFALELFDAFNSWEQQFTVLFCELSDGIANMNIFKFFVELFCADHEFSLAAIAKVDRPKGENEYGTRIVRLLHHSLPQADSQICQALVLSPTYWQQK